MSTEQLDITKFALPRAASVQKRIRRGTAAEHAAFIGALGEVTMDTTAKTLRVHDGETLGGFPLARQSDLDAVDYVIDTYRAPDGSAWYRRYKSGWVEQGGLWTGQVNGAFGKEINIPVTFSIKMQDTEYMRAAYCANPAYCMQGGFNFLTKTGMTVIFLPYQMERTVTSVIWTVSGFFE